MAFWVLVAFLAIEGTFADVALSFWSKSPYSAKWGLTTTTLLVVFYAGFATAMRLGEARGANLTIVVVMVLLCNIVFVALWNLRGGIQFTPLQWIGIGMAMMAIACLELGKKG